MKHFLHFFGPALLLAALGSPALAQDEAAERAQQDQHLKEQRQAIDRRLAAQEALCYQRFAASDCLRNARRAAREERAQLQELENARKEAVRRERAAQHGEDVQARQRAAADSAARAPAASGAQPPRAAHLPGSRAPNATRIRQVQEARAQATAQRAVDAENARTRLVEKQRAAALRVQSQQRRQADRDAKGRPKPAPLGDPP